MQNAWFSGSLCLIDFGGCLHESESYRGTAGTRQFRAPELVLGLHWSFPVDLWAAGGQRLQASMGGLSGS